MCEIHVLLLFCHTHAVIGSAFWAFFFVSIKLWRIGRMSRATTSSIAAFACAIENMSLCVLFGLPVLVYNPSVISETMSNINAKHAGI